MVLLTQNSKLKKTSKKTGTKILSFGLPAVKTCPMAGACKAGCYATAGAYRFKQARAARKARYELTLTDEFVPAMIAEIKKRKPTHVRIHDSGDFYNIDYIGKWFQIIKQFPHVTFYAYTKQVVIFAVLDAVNAMPLNLILIYSYGGKQDKCIIPGRDRHCKVFETIEELENAGYVNGTENDLVAIGPNKKIGLVYHGTKSFYKTDWRPKGLYYKRKGEEKE
jgi:hypothetical protein